MGGAGIWVAMVGLPRELVNEGIREGIRVSWKPPQPQGSLPPSLHGQIIPLFSGTVTRLPLIGSRVKAFSTPYRDGRKFREARPLRLPISALVDLWSFDTGCACFAPDHWGSSRTSPN